jgi:hypothetical protein
MNVSEVIEKPCVSKSVPPPNFTKLPVPDTKPLIVSLELVSTLKFVVPATITGPIIECMPPVAEIDAEPPARELNEKVPLLSVTPP